MNRPLTASALGIAILLASGCGDQPGEQPANNANAAAQQPEAQLQTDLNSVELPPMVVRSASYRCDDGRALYVDILDDKAAVLVRDSRADIPTRLAREGDEGPFEGDERSLSGTGSEVRYSSPDRPAQSCRQAQV